MKIKIVKDVIYRGITVFRRGDIVDVVSVTSHDVYNVLTPMHIVPTWNMRNFTLYGPNCLSDSDTEAIELSPLELLAMSLE